MEHQSLYIPTEVKTLWHRPYMISVGCGTPTISSRLLIIHAQANGKVERMNGTLCDMARAFAVETGTKWDEHVGAVLFAYGSAMHSTSRASPANMLFTRELCSALDAELDPLYIEHYRIAPYEEILVSSW